MEGFPSLRENNRDCFWKAEGNPPSGLVTLGKERVIKMSVRHIWICGLLLMVLNGCHMFPYRSPELLDDPKLAARLFTALDERVPVVLQSTQRVTVSTGIRSWDFLGFLQYYPNGDFRAILMAETGGKALDVEHLEETSATRVLWSVPTFPKEVVRKSVPGDVKHLFDRYPLEICRAARHVGGRNSLVVQLAPDHTIEYVFDRKDQSVVESFEVEKGELIRRASYDKLKDFPKAKINRLTPSRIRLKNLKEDYKIDIQLLQLEFAQASAREHDENEDKNAKQTANSRKNTPQTRQSTRANTRVANPQPSRNSNKLTDPRVQTPKLPANRQVVAEQADPALQTPDEQMPANQQTLAEQRALLNQQRAIERRLQALRESNPDLAASVGKSVAPVKPTPQPTPSPQPQPNEALLPDPSLGQYQQPAPEAPRKTTPLRRRTNRFIRTR
jgi:hypothetical protein